MNYSVVSLGCKVNQSEGEDIASGLSAAGLEPAGKGEAADVIIVNTCTVTGEADRKSRKAIYQAVKRRAGDGALVVVTGCYASVAAGELEKIEGVALVVGQVEKSGIVGTVLERVRHEAQKKVSSPLEGGGWKVGVRNASATRPLTPAPQGRGNSLLRVRAYLKVQDGCDNRCAYCIVPDARGYPTSVPEDEVLRRAGELAAGGAKEIVLTGINIGKYGNHSAEIAAAANQPRYNGPNTLTDLIQLVLDVPGVARVRVSSIEPEDVTLDMIGMLVSREPQITSREDGAADLTGPYLCPHLHIPLQAGDNRTLKRMGRRYVTGEFLRLVNSIRHAKPDAAITTDLIVGFPGETDEEFANTLRFLEQTRPSRMHVFQYSRRAGTPAADMPDQVPEEVKADRSRQAREAGERYAAEYRASFDGREVNVLVERVRDGAATGTSENYLAVSFPAADARPGSIVRVAL